MTSAESELLARIGAGERRPLYLVSGEILLAETAGQRIAQALAAAGGAEIQTYRHPESLTSRIEDLRTFSLFGGAKLAVVIDSGVFADRRGAAHLIDQAAEALPVPSEGELSERGRQAAGRLLQVCRLFGFEPYAGAPEEVLGALPDWVFAGGAPPGGRAKRKRPEAAVEELRTGLAGLLALAAGAGLEGWAESDAADLARVAADGLPDGHHLVLCEVAVAADHPVAERLRAEGALLELTRVGVDRQGRWQGLDELAAELAEATGVTVARPALEELTRRTLRRTGGPGGGTPDSDSTARFAAEYRKLAALAGSGIVGPELVRQEVEDRGEEDVFKLLDAIGEGRGGEALSRLERMIEGAGDATAARLSFFGQLAGYCRRLTAVAGMMEACDVPPGERSYNRFKARYADVLGGSPPGSDTKPIGKLHPYPLHKAYLAACRFPSGCLAALPARVLETEMRLKGESDDPQAALANLVVYLCTAGNDC